MADGYNDTMEQLRLELIDAKFCLVFSKCKEDPMVMRSDVNHAINLLAGAIELLNKIKLQTDQPSTTCGGSLNVGEPNGV